MPFHKKVGSKLHDFRMEQLRKENARLRLQAEREEQLERLRTNRAQLMERVNKAKPKGNGKFKKFAAAAGRSAVRFVESQAAAQRKPARMRKRTRTVKARCPKPKKRVKRRSRDPFGLDAFDFRF